MLHEMQTKGSTSVEPKRKHIADWCRASEKVQPHTSGWIEEVKRDPRPLDDKQLWGEAEPQQVIPEEIEGIMHDDVILPETNPEVPAQKAEPQRVTVPEDLRELHDAVMAFETNPERQATAMKLIERLGAAEQRAMGENEKYLKQFALTVIVEGERDRLRRERDELAEEVFKVAAKWEPVRDQIILLQAERDRLKEQLAAMTKNRDQWERNSAAENNRAGDSGVTIRNLRAKVAELEGKVRDMEEVGSQFDTTTARLHERIEELKTEKARIGREALERVLEGVKCRRMTLRNGRAINVCKDIENEIQALIGGGT